MPLMTNPLVPSIRSEMSLVAVKIAFVIFPSPTASEMVKPLVGLESVTVKRSTGSNRPSASTVTVMVPVVSPSSMVSMSRGGRVVAAGRRRQRRGGKVDADAAGRCGRAQGHREHRVARVLAARGVIDGDRRAPAATATSGVIVGDGAEALTLGDGRARGVEQVDEERLRALDRRIVQDRHAGGLRRHAGRERQRARDGGVIAARQRRVVVTEKVDCRSARRVARPGHP